MKLIITCVIFSIILVGFIKYNGFYETYSQGERSGVIYKTSYKGLIFKSQESEMSLNGVSSDVNGTMLPNKWFFSCKDEIVIKKIKEAVQNGKRVNISYNEYLIKPITISTNYVVTDITYVK